MRKFAERLRELRIEKNLSGVALGKVLGVSDTAISYWENGKCDVMSDHLLNIAKFFGVSTDYLLGLRDD